MNLFDNASQWLESQRDEYLTTKVSYRTLSGKVLELNAAIGSTMFRADDEYGVTVYQQARDFLILAEALGVEPKKGETIVSKGCRYEVLAPNGEPVWRWSGTNNTTYRIHTKYIGDENE